MSSQLEKLKTELKLLKAENKALNADNPKRMKTQIKRLQDENRSKNAEITQLKSRLKQVQTENSDQESVMQEMGETLETLKVLETPHWESEDKTWAVYLEMDQGENPDEPVDFNLRLVDLKTGGAKMPHMDKDGNGNPELVWPRMRTIPKDVKTAIENLIEM